ncbi:MAG: hypothetical protein AB4042_14035, partial [Leptolyngbyaceae cyanobacterium]
SALLVTEAGEQASWILTSIKNQFVFYNYQVERDRYKRLENEGRQSKKGMADKRKNGMGGGDYIDTGGGDYIKNQIISGDYTQTRSQESNNTQGDISKNSASGNIQNNKERPSSPEGRKLWKPLGLLVLTIILGLFSGLCTPEGRNLFKLDGSPSDSPEQETQILPEDAVE